MFQALSTLVDRWRALRGQRVIDKRYGKDYDKLFSDQISLALEAADRGARESAQKIWHELRRNFPAQSARSPWVLRLLLKLGTFDEADAMMAEGRKRYPRFEHFAIGYVEVAHRRGDIEETLRRCKIIRKQFPRLAEGYTVAAELLSKLGRHDEAEAMIERALHKVPPALRLLADYARHAERCRDWQEALRRWDSVRSQFDHVYSYNGIAHCLRQMRRLDEAEKVAIETCDRFPTDPWAFATLARIAGDRGDLDEATRRWDMARRHCPFFAHAYEARAEAERRAGREDKADEILASGVRMARGDLDLHLQYARSSQRRGDWAEAVKRWALVRHRFPECDEARQRSAEALAAVTQQGALAAGADASVDMSEAQSSGASHSTLESAKGG